MPTFDTLDDDAIAALVSRFYGKACKDAMIGPVFHAAVDDWAAHLRKLGDFWSSVMLTSGRYKGNPMAAHLRQPIEPAFFERWLALWRETARELFAPELAARFCNKAENIAESLKLAMFYRPTMRETIADSPDQNVSPGGVAPGASARGSGRNGAPHPVQGAPSD
jgi:hemoglobin